MNDTNSNGVTSVTTIDEAFKLSKASSGPSKEEKAAAKAAELAQLVQERSKSLNDDDAAKAVRAVYENGTHIKVNQFQLIVLDNALTNGDGNASRTESIAELFKKPEMDELIGSLAVGGFRPGAKNLIIRQIPFDRAVLLTMEKTVENLAGKYTTKIPCGTLGKVDWNLHAFQAWLKAGYAQVSAEGLPLYVVVAGNRRTLASLYGYFLREKVLNTERCRTMPAILCPDKVDIGGRLIDLPPCTYARLNIAENGLEKVGTQELGAKDHIKSASNLLRNDPFITQAKITALLGIAHATSQKYTAFARFVNQFPNLDVLTFDPKALTPIQERYAAALSVTPEVLADAFMFKGIASGAEMDRYMAGDYNDPSKVALIKADDKTKEKIAERANAFNAFIQSRKPCMAVVMNAIRSNPESTASEVKFADRLELVLNEGYIPENGWDFMGLAYLVSYVVGGNRRKPSEAGAALPTAKIANVSAKLCSVPGFGGMAGVLDSIAKGDEAGAELAVAEIAKAGALMQAVQSLVDLVGAEEAEAYIKNYEVNMKAIKAGKKAK